MKYLCLVYYAESEADAMTQSEWHSLVGECLDCAEGLRQSGRLIAGEALQPVHTATTVRVRGGKALITDGPFAETKEQLAGFYLIQAEDLDEAIRSAAEIPPARFGSIEIRPIRELVPT
ncbi:MAG TPA: YciI family protein [Gammaproteobacteria bacterium]